MEASGSPLLDAIGGASRAFSTVLWELTETAPGVVVYVAWESLADRLGLWVASEENGLATGLLSAEDGHAHIHEWEATVEQRERFDQYVRRPDLPVPIPVVSFLMVIERTDHVGGQWLALRRYRSVN